ncbi:hypothetical protein GUITHDRAFT_122367 [Guillardia theta CCMP2712]|uniref:Receptor ligand binding region domain-containing protein n=2 Tax=Guillardia theta TaxID=55529 RepID=L1I5D2_GUITC|nr:hypothetical protein GUITHDRAFT_122367 [Guillardia theta CCMP2712]EKX31446.1 hypothetical protein GUITHDRAFT_122367 [Guillardia theta CCMP2712]|eukprot:XP_005818426.1 hypothetical protein GUITHDRAFT_122367 [Guillardia theta CCMP2712]
MADANFLCLLLLLSHLTLGFSARTSASLLFVSPLRSASNTSAFSSNDLRDAFLALAIAARHVNARSNVVVKEAASLPRPFQLNVSFLQTSFSPLLIARDILSWSQPPDAIVANLDTFELEAACSLTAPSGLSVMSYSAKLKSFADKALFPFLSRTSLTLEFDALAAATILKQYAFSSILALYQDSPEGNEFAAGLKLLQEPGVMVEALPVSLPPDASLMASIASSPASVILLYSSSSDLLELLLALADAHQLLSDRTWVLAGEVDPEVLVGGMKNPPAARQLLAGWLWIREAPLTGREGLMLKMWEDANASAAAVGLEPSFSSSPSILAAFAYDAVWAMAFGLAGSTGGGRELADETRKREFAGLTGEVRFVNQTGDRALLGFDFEVGQLLVSSSGLLIYEVVATWSVTRGLLKTKDVFPPAPGSTEDAQTPPPLVPAPRGTSLSKTLLLVIIIVPSLLFLLTCCCCGAIFVYWRRSQLEEELDSELKRAMAEVREALRIRAEDGFFLARERSLLVRSWRRRKVEGTLSLSQLVAISSLFCMRDFDPRAVDLLGTFLRDVDARSRSREQEESWGNMDLAKPLTEEGSRMLLLLHLIVNVCVKLLDPTHSFSIWMDLPDKEEGQRLGGGDGRGSGRRTKGALSNLVDDDFEFRFQYFREKLLQLRMWRDYPRMFALLQEELKEHMDYLAASCTSRYHDMQSLPHGLKLVALPEISWGPAGIHTQDHSEVGAIRVDEAAREEMRYQQESQLGRQVEGGHVLEEDLFLSQLHSRANLLDQEFQRRVFELVASHASASPSLQHHSHLASGSSSAGSRSGIFVDCDFEDGRSVVEVCSAPVKRKERMREKLEDYAEDGKTWPLTRHILDPVRSSIVCEGPSQMLEVLGWVTGSSSMHPLMPLVRVKNKFAVEEVEDGYRDIQVCVVFSSSSSSLRIIGEIQIHDRKIHDQKVKMQMHKLYKIRRTDSPDGVK